MLSGVTVFAVLVYLISKCIAHWRKRRIHMKQAEANNQHNIIEVKARKSTQESITIVPEGSLQPH